MVQLAICRFTCALLEADTNALLLRTGPSPAWHHRGSVGPPQNNALDCTSKRLGDR